ncbi:hypothetical protein BD311DRAFT_767279 [Dichomitus squalens]|uniref:Uncharacterized protein n=1 Tax=Dichomitus squalens TaxID=114155 RepID=A0A4Q9MDJ5_9APHY|nr:hypothetical protein BD311DRAFT_767279 [Dichomitus squalens]
MGTRSRSVQDLRPQQSSNSVSARTRSILSHMDGISLPLSSRPRVWPGASMSSHTVFANAFPSQTLL